MQDSEGVHFQGKFFPAHELMLSGNVGILPTVLHEAECDPEQSRAIIGSLPDCFLESWPFPAESSPAKSVTERRDKRGEKVKNQLYIPLYCVQFYGFIHTGFKIIHLYLIVLWHRENLTANPQKQWSEIADVLFQKSTAGTHSIRGMKHDLCFLRATLDVLLGEESTYLSGADR